MAGGELIDSASWNVVLTVGISVGGLAAKKTLQNILRSELVRTIGTECTERLLKEYGDVKDLSRCVKHILKMDIGAGVIIEMSEKFGKSGLDWILGKKSVGLTDDLVRKILKAESLDNFTDAVVKAIKQSKGYVDDIIEQIIKYGDDAAEVIKDYGDDAIRDFSAGDVLDEIRVRTYRKATNDDLELINAIKGKYNAGKTRNAAVAKGKINGEYINLECISGNFTHENYLAKGNFVPPQPSDYFYCGPEPEYVNHTEQKIIEYLRSIYIGAPKISGEVEIISERAFCDNCKVLVDMFEKEFPNIKVIRVQIVK
ncbi:MAG: hypothetical protein NC300_12930 [Bacteroidales bacterium]|nr:hypothetical protein [Bacteroidales bacterium]